MTGLLTADEAARLAPGEQLVIVRAGGYSDDGGERALQRMQQMSMPQGSDKLGRPYHQVTGHPLFPPQDWVALTGPCPTCDGRGTFTTASTRGKWETDELPCTDCRDGRRIVPLYIECPTCEGWNTSYDDDGDSFDCPDCDGGRVLVGRGSIIGVVPVVRGPLDTFPDEPCIEVTSVARYWHRAADYLVIKQYTMLPLDPLPVPGVDFGIIIDCVEETA